MSKHCARCNISVFGEGDDVADGVCTGHHGNDTVETESDTAVRRSTELESVKQEAELLSGFFRTNLQCIEDFCSGRLPCGYG